MKPIFEIDREEVERKAEDYIKNLKYDASDEEKANIKELYIANSMRQLEKMKAAYDLEYRKVQKNRAKAKFGRKQNIARRRGHK